MFVRRIWKDREVSFPNRRKLTLQPSGTEETVIVQRDEGEIIQAGDPFNALNMNDLETRAYNGIHACDDMMGTVMDGATATDDTLKVGRYFVHQGDFYVVTRDIPQGGNITPGTNCTRTRISTVLTNLNNSVTSLRTNLTARVDNLTKTLNNSIATLTEMIGQHGSVISDIETNTLGMCHVTENITVSGGSGNLSPLNVGNYIRYGSVVGVIVTAVGGSQSDVWGGTIIDSRPTNCVIHVANLSNPSFSGSVRLEVIILGRAYA